MGEAALSQVLLGRWVPVSVLDPQRRLGSVCRREGDRGDVSLELLPIRARLLNRCHAEIRATIAFGHVLSRWEIWSGPGVLGRSDATKTWVHSGANHPHRMLASRNSK